MSSWVHSWSSKVDDVGDFDSEAGVDCDVVAFPFTGGTGKGACVDVRNDALWDNMEY